MPRFYFHICNGTGLIEDEEGQDLPSVEAARLEAMRSARDVMAGDVQRGILDLSSFIEIEDADHQLIETLSFQDAIDLTQRH